MVVLLVVTTLLAVGAAAGGWMYYRRSRHLRDRLDDANRDLEQLQRTFNRFAPARVVDDILERRSLDIAETRDVTILFADLRGFTALSEQLDAPDLVALLNRYFQGMDRAVDEHSGFISKFIGDGLLVLFGALHDNPWQSTDAVKAALAMQERVEALDVDGDVELSLSVGIHRGPVVAGIVGSLEVKEFTVVGRHVNLASRVEELTRTHDANILITEAVREDLDPAIAVTKQPSASVKGVQAPITTYAVSTDQRAGGDEGPAGAPGSSDEA
jgi:adenylate cyclase